MLTIIIGGYCAIVYLMFFEFEWLRWNKLTRLVSITIGIVIALGFAGALAQVGLAQRDIPLTLLMFNVGVETGQLLFVVSC